MADQNFFPPWAPWAARARCLTKFLVLSGTLNIALLATFSFFLLKDSKNEKAVVLHPISDPSPKKPIETLTNAEVLRAYCDKDFTELLQLLEDKQLIEEGYTKRDLALAVLVAFHHFNLERALGGMAISQRQILFSPYRHAEQTDLSIFPDLVDEQFHAIISYAKTERWPLTNQGLYFELKRALLAHSHFESIDKTLKDAFCLSQEFLAIETLFSRTESILSKEELLQLVCEGNWSILERFAAVQKYSQDFSLERRRILLIEYLDVHSKIAARLLLGQDAEFIVRRLKDEHIFMILEEGKAEPKTLTLAKALLCSMRSNRIYRAAAAKLYRSIDEHMPEPYEHVTSLQKFCPEIFTLNQPTSPSPKTTAGAQPKPVVDVDAKKVYIVQEGDSLWKIARKHRVKLETLMHVNHLESDKLRVGKKLEIPD